MIQQLDPHSIDRLLSGIADITPCLRDGAPEAERLGRLPDASIEALRRIGLFRLWWPIEVGGPGATLLEALQVVERLAAVDTAAAWILAVGSAHGGFVASYTAQEVVDRVFAEEQPFVAGQLAPVGQAHRVPGGLSVSGSWSFGSGIAHADWMLAGALLTSIDGDPSVPVVVVVPADQVDIDRESWQVTGLIGTGSCDYTMTDVFVPGGWWFSFPVAERQRGGPIYDLPIPAQAIILHGGFVLGAARRCLDEITRISLGRYRANSPTVLARRPTFALELGRWHTRLASCGLYVHDRVRVLQEATGANVLNAMVEARAAARLATDVAIELATWTFRQGGAPALQLDHPLQRTLRDVLAAAQHLYVDDVAYSALGESLIDRTTD